MLRGGREACWLAWLMQGGDYGYKATRLQGYEGRYVQGGRDTVAGRDVSMNTSDRRDRNREILRKRTDKASRRFGK